ncbi:MAG: DUF222 domain-containing protein, partial [Gemmatimonadota bacterium]
MSRDGVLVREDGVKYDWGPDADTAPVAEAVSHPASDSDSEVDTQVGSDGSSEVGTDADTESLEALEHEITTLSAHVHAAEHRLLVLIAEFDRRGGWKPGGHPSCAEWLHFRTGIDRGAARERVRAAHALQGLPRVSEAMSRGELSFSKVRALTRLGDGLDEQAEEELVEFARQATAAELEKLVRGWKLLGRADEAELERRRHASRWFSVFPDDDGMYVVRGRLDPEVGALLMRAIEAAGDALHRPGLTWAAEGGQRGPHTTEVTPRQRRADAMGLLAERAMAAGFGGDGAVEEGAAEEDAVEEGPMEQGQDAGVNGQGQERDAPRTPLSGSRAERYQVILHVDRATLREGGATCDCTGGPGRGDGRGGAKDSGRVGRRKTLREPGRSHLEDGTRVSAETSRRLTCDAAVVRVSGSGEESRGGPENRKDPGEPLHIGRRTRTIPPALRRALDLRDGGCRFPGCGLRFTDAHHIVHWADGGETSLGACPGNGVRPHAGVLHLCRVGKTTKRSRATVRRRDDLWTVQPPRALRVTGSTGPS